MKRRIFYLFVAKLIYTFKRFRNTSYTFRTGSNVNYRLHETFYFKEYMAQRNSVTLLVASELSTSRLLVSACLAYPAASSRHTAVFLSKLGKSISLYLYVHYNRKRIP